MNFFAFFKNKKDINKITKVPPEVKAVEQVSKEDYIYSPLRTALLPLPAELQYALSVRRADPRPLLDIIRKLPQAATHLIGLVGKRHDAVLSLQYEVKPAKPNGEDKRELKRCDEITNRLVKSNFGKLLKNLTNSNIFGHSVTIPHWSLDNNNQYIANYEPVDFVHFAPRGGKVKLLIDKSDRTYAADIGDNARLLGFNDKNSLLAAIEGSRGLYWADLNPDFVLTSFVNPFEGLERDYLGGYMRVLLYYTLLLHYDVLDWAKFNEMYQMPLRVGKYDSYAGDKAVEVLRQAVRNLGSDASAIIDKTTEIEFVETKSAKNGDGYAKFAEYIERKQSVLIRGETLTTQVDRAGGNRALGQVHQQVGEDKLLADIKTISETVNKLVRKDYFLNYGQPPNGRFPHFSIYPKEYKDLELYANIISTLSGAGVEFSKAWIHDTFKTKPPESEEDAVGGKQSLLL